MLPVLLVAMPGVVCAIPNTAVDTEDTADIGDPGRNTFFELGKSLKGRLPGEADSLHDCPIGRLEFTLILICKRLSLARRGF